MINDCKTLYHTVNDRTNKISMEVTRESANINETLEILIENTLTSDIYLKNYLTSIGENRDLIDGNQILKQGNLYEDYNNIGANKVGYFGSYMTRNVSIAIPNVDYEPIKQIIKFMPGEMIKVIF